MKQYSGIAKLVGNNYTINHEPFNDALKRKRGMTDMDGVAEIGGSLFLLEWKNGNSPLRRSQEILFENFIGRNGSDYFDVAVCVWGQHKNSEGLMEVHKAKMWYKKNGRLRTAVYENATVETIQNLLKRWEVQADLCWDARKR